MESHLKVVVRVIALLAVLGAGCSTPAGDGGPQSQPLSAAMFFSSLDPTKPAIHQTADPAPDASTCDSGATRRQVDPAPFRSVSIVLDNSTSPPPGMRSEGFATAADYIRTLPVVGAGSRVSVVLIGVNSYDLDHLMPPVVIPAVKPPTYPPPPEQPNPVSAQDRARYTREKAEWCEAVRHANSQMDDALRAAQGAAEKAATAILTVDRNPEPGTDINGAIARAAMQFEAEPPGTVLELGIVSDMAPFPVEQMQEALPSLKGTRVIISAWNPDRNEAAALRQNWSSRFQAAGVTQFDWLPPRQEWSAK